MGCNYEVWTSLWSLQPDGISIFQPANEIRPEPNGGRREREVNLFKGRPNLVKKYMICPEGRCKHLPLCFIGGLTA